DGKLRACCNALPGEVFMNQGISKGFSQSDYFESLRMATDFPDVCKRCWSEEACGIESMRIKKNRSFAAVVGEESQPVLRYLDLKLGNTCNLQCRMCLPNFSNRIENEGIIQSRLKPDWS